MEIKPLLDLVAKEKASDLLITAGAPPMLRVNGDLFRTKHDSLTPEQARQLVYSFLSKDQRAQFEADKELDFSLAMGRKHRFRVNVYLQKEAVTAALRPIPENIPSLQELGLPEYIEKLAMAKQGLVLITGPTGHGKTTTLASIIDIVNNKRACHVITVEDPIEYVHYHKKSIVDQREVGGDTHSFANALKYVLRQTPDVILIGEMRDLETMAAALTIAETGHLTLATLHTNSTYESINRIVDSFPASQQGQVRAQLAFVLEGVITQQLIPRTNGKGRVLVCEVMVCTPAIRATIRDDKVHQIYGLMQAGQKFGMQTMNQGLFNAAIKGDISTNEALRRSADAEELANMLGTKVSVG